MNLVEGSNESSKLPQTPQSMLGKSQQMVGRCLPTGHHATIGSSIFWGQEPCSVRNVGSENKFVFHASSIRFGSVDRIARDESRFKYRNSLFSLIQRFPAL
jgi:hypothetical protein